MRANGTVSGRTQEAWYARRRSTSTERVYLDKCMRFYSFQIVVEKEPDDEGYYAHTPTLPGCFSNGKTIEEARRNIREAIAQHMSSLRSRGETIPQNDRLVHVEELTLGVPGEVDG